MKPEKYRRKPIEVEAMQFKGGPDAALEIIGWILSHDGRASYETVNMDTLHGMIGIQTMEGRMHATPGDFIIRGMWGEFHPCKPDVFAQMYDLSDSIPLISPGNRRIIEQAYDDGTGNGITLIASEDPSWFVGMYDGCEMCVGIEHDGVLYIIVSASGGGLVSVVVGKDLIGDESGTTFPSIKEAKAYIQGCIAE